MALLNDAYPNALSLNSRIFDNVEKAFASDPINYEAIIHSLWPIGTEVGAQITLAAWVTRWESLKADQWAFTHFTQVLRDCHERRQYQPVLEIRESHPLRV
jgi:hypothetical protein